LNGGALSQEELAHYEYALNPERIAQRPLPRRADARLLCWERDGSFSDRRIEDLPARLRPGDLVILNDSKVLPARLFGQSAGGGKLELLLLRPASPQPGWWALCKPGRKLQPGSEFSVEGGSRIRVVATREDGARRIERVDEGSLEQLASEFGHMPLPPYIRRPDEKSDRERYQTVYAKHSGSVAAPTAGLHVDEELLAAMRDRGAEVQTVTLHVGLDTFRPLEEAQLASGRLHGERFRVGAAAMRALHQARADGRRIIAWGSTSCRVLESLPDSLPEAMEGETTLFIRPGYRFRFVDVLLTNFHLPRSSLLMMVGAFAGQRWRSAYEHALAAGYRFYSYGDANWIERLP
jgi:S-adenosylmethionine:tRNA ribosyltransferase-isomerase